MRLHPRSMPANAARAQLAYDVWKLLEASDLTDVEALQALGEVQFGIMKGLLRTERHQGHDEDGEVKGDEACGVVGCPGYHESEA